MSFPSSAIGLPQALKYDLPPSLPDSARSYSVNVAPDGVTQVTGPNITSLFTANQALSPQFTSQMISFTLPSGMSDSVFLDPHSTTLSFTLTYQLSTASTVTNGRLTNISSGASWFDSLVLYSNNTPIETVNQYGLLQNFLLQNTVNQSERFGGISVSMGADTNSATGLELANASTGLYRYNYCIPLLSVIGVNSDKFIPIGAINNMQLQMTTANLAPIVAYCTATTTQPVFSTPFTLTDFTLNMKYIDVGDMAGQLLKQTLQDGKWFLKSQTYTNSSVSIPSGSGGTQQILLQIRNTSVKSVFHQFGMSNAVAAQSLISPNGYYDAINIGTNSRQLQVGGNFYPNKPINDLQRPAEAYNYLIQSLGGGLAKSLGTVVTRGMYNSCGAIASVPAGSDTWVVLPSTAILRPAPTGADDGNVDIIKYPSSAFYGYDLEKSSGILFQGVNTRASPPFLNLNLATQLNASVNCQAWGLSDVILQIDTINKQVTAFI